MISFYFSILITHPPSFPASRTREQTCPRCSRRFGSHLVACGRHARRHRVLLRGDGLRRHRRQRWPGMGQSAHARLLVERDQTRWRSRGRPLESGGDKLGPRRPASARAPAPRAHTDDAVGSNPSERSEPDAGPVDPDAVTRADFGAYVVEDEQPEADQRPGVLRLGLYRGVPETSHSGRSPGTLPGTATLNRIPIVTVCTHPEDVPGRVLAVLVHGGGHAMGLSEARLRELASPPVPRRSPASQSERVRWLVEAVIDEFLPRTPLGHMTDSATRRAESPGTGA